VLAGIERPPAGTITPEVQTNFTTVPPVWSDASVKLSVV
jgi:hypothetical protein